jgi:hypothetical protein
LEKIWYTRVRSCRKCIKFTPKVYNLSTFVISDKSQPRQNLLYEYSIKKTPPKKPLRIAKILAENENIGYFLSLNFYLGYEIMKWRNTGRLVLNRI